MSQTQPRHRARNYEEYRALITDSDDSDKRPPVQFTPKVTDVIITPYSKSGTTWLQQIVHTLRTRGDMDFDDISRVVPWIEVANELGMDIEAPQKAEPRAFKSHNSWYKIPKGGRYIVSIRDPRDVLVSSYRFMEGWYFEPGALTITEFSTNFLNPKPDSGYWHHLRSWWPQRHRDNVLILSFESMKQDLQGTIEKVARFAGIELDDELLTIVLRNASFAFMKEHGDRFDDLLMRERSEQRLNLPAGSDSSKVRKGEVGVHAYELTPDINNRLDELWHQEITGRLGFVDYAALRAEIMGVV